MRPIKLIMSAFGPYSGREVIDFEELQGRNLFLVTGPTGSGKTTIFDAISYALYGKASGDMRTEDTLRSHFSEVDVLTEVELTFELKKMIYHIHRIPSQKRPKLKGDGFADQKPEASLTIEDGEPRTIVTGVNKVNQKVEDIIGINVEQFKQIMMIPQGEFRKLLTSDSQEREKVLQQLFDTYVYRKIQTDLKDQSISLGNEIKSKKIERDTLASKIKYANREEIGLLIETEDKNIDRIIELTKSMIQEDLLELKSVEKNIKDQDKQLEDLLKAQNKAEEDNKNIEKAQLETQTLKELESHSEEMIEQKHKLVMAEKVLRLVGIEENIESSEVKINRKKTDLLEVERLKNNCQELLTQAKSDYEAKTSLESENHRKEQVISLEDYKKYIEKVKQLSDIKASIKKLEQKIQGNKEAEKKNNKGLEDLALELIKNKEECQLTEKAEVQLQKTKGIFEAEEAFQGKLQKLEKQLDHIEAEKVKFKTLHGEVEEAHKKFELAEIDYKQSKMAFLLNQAGIIAAELNESQPCPVCGSIDHPNLAVLNEDSVSEEELEQLEVKMKEMNKAYTKVNTALGVQEEKIVGMKNSLQELAFESLKVNQKDFLAGDSNQQLLLVKTEIDNSSNKLKSIEEEIRQYKADFERYKTLKLRAVEIEKNTKSYTSELLLLGQEKLELMSMLKGEQTRLDIIHSEVPEELREMGRLTNLIEELTESINKDLETLKKVKEIYEKTKDRYTEIITRAKEITNSIQEDEKALLQLKKSFDNKLQEADFESFEVYKAAKLQEEEINQLKEEQENYYRLVSQLQGSLKELRNKTKGLTLVDLQKFTSRQNEIQIERNEQLSKQGTLKAMVNDNKETIVIIQKINDQIKDKETRYKVIGQLAKVSQGQNPAMMTFERYVLAAFLEDILKAANIRLKQMTQGRYILSRTSELQRKNKQSGLELEVFDNFTGKSRHVKTLSGGEGFKASLSMALGLSDVVQSYAGGVRLDTMFIDEGFGTLDQESLDSAINCLIDLQKTGRLVGIISHVQELKERIDTRLEISSTNQGSESHFVLG